MSGADADDSNNDTFGSGMEEWVDDSAKLEAEHLSFLMQNVPRGKVVDGCWI
jgi:hypothetical protein